MARISRRIKVWLTAGYLLVKYPIRMTIFRWQMSKRNKKDCIGSFIFININIRTAPLMPPEFQNGLKLRDLDCGKAPADLKAPDSAPSPGAVNDFAIELKEF
jgi:hypothetical protein